MRVSSDGDLVVHVEDDESDVEVAISSISKIEKVLRGLSMTGELTVTSTVNPALRVPREKAGV